MIFHRRPKRSTPKIRPLPECNWQCLNFSVLASNHLHRCTSVSSLKSSAITSTSARSWLRYRRRQQPPPRDCRCDAGGRWPTSFQIACGPYRRTASRRWISTIRKQRRHSTRSSSLRISPSVLAGDGVDVTARGSDSTASQQQSSSVRAGAAASRMRLAVSSARACCSCPRPPPSSRNR